MNNDDMNDDAEFEAFLAGKDALSRRLQALPQPSPGAELDAAIMKRVKFAVAQQGRAAANDAGAATPQLAPGFAYRWRVPAGIAATVLVGLFAQQAFQASGQHEAPATVSETSAVILAPVQEEKPALIPPVEMVMPSPAMQSRAPMAEPMPAPSVAAAPPPPEPPKVAADAAAPQKPSAAAAELREAEVAAAPAARARMDTAVEKKAMSAGLVRALPAPDAWLARIDALLSAGEGKLALEQWEQFKAAYPAHAVPEALAARIKAGQASQPSPEQN